MISLLITVLIILAVIGIGWWAINQLSLPPPIRMVAVVVIAVVAIVLLLRLMPGGGHLLG